MTDVAIDVEDDEPRVTIYFEGNVTNKQAHTAEVILGGDKRTLASTKPEKADKKKKKKIGAEKTREPVRPEEKTKFISIAVNAMYLITHHYYSKTGL